MFELDQAFRSQRFVQRLAHGIQVDQRRVFFLRRPPHLIWIFAQAVGDDVSLELCRFTDVINTGMPPFSFTARIHFISVALYFSAAFGSPIYIVGHTGSAGSHRASSDS